MEDRQNIADKKFPNDQHSESLKFQFNKNFLDEGQIRKNFNKGKTINTFNNNKNKIIKDVIEKFGSSLGSTESKNPRFSRKVSRNSLFANRGKNRLRKFLTFTEDNINKVKMLGNTTNVNINININKIELEKNPVVEIKPAEDNQNPVRNKETSNANRKFNKVKNLIKLVRRIIEPEVEKHQEISQLTNHIKERKNKSAERSDNTQKHSNSSFVKFMEKPDIEKEFIRVYLKERIFKIITEGAYKKSIKQDIEEIFSKNYDRFVYDSDNPKFLFNQHLSDGKTLFYHACVEGNLEVVKIFLEKNLNPSILSKSDSNESETCLQVAARWGYNDIVVAILEKRFHLIKTEEIEKTLEIENLKPSIVKLLKSFLKLKNKKSKNGCACF